MIVVDPLISTEVAAAALKLYREHRGDREVVAVIHSHSHVDHFGGVRGVVSQEDVDSGKVPIIAPAGFLDAAVSENVAAGNVMTRRSMYQCISAGASVSGVIMNSKVRPSISRVSPVKVMSSVGGIRVIVPSEVPIPRPQPTVP